MKQKIPHLLRAEINSRIKNGLDISDLIEPYDIKGEDFTNARIKRFRRPDDDISGLIACNVIFGEEGGEKIVLNRAIARNCNFQRAVFKTELLAKGLDARGSNFCKAFLPYVDYRYADLRGCDFCGTVFTITTPKAIGAKFDERFFKELAKFWNVEIRLKTEETNEQTKL
jgi:uncharacterized protein YjbI with pentapeptide repeats